MRSGEVASLADVLDELDNECDGLVGLVGSTGRGMSGMAFDPDLAPSMALWLSYTGSQLEAAARTMGDMARAVEAAQAAGRGGKGVPDGAAGRGCPMARRDEWTPERVAAELSGPGGLYGAVSEAARLLGELSGRLEGADREAAARVGWELRGALAEMRGDGGGLPVLLARRGRRARRFQGEGPHAVRVRLPGRRGVGGAAGPWGRCAVDRRARGLLWPARPFPFRARRGGAWGGETPP